MAIAEHGYQGTTIAHITRAAAVSRRTFYEHFADKWAAAQALASESVSDASASLSESGLTILIVEVIATGVNSEIDAARRVNAADRVLGDLAATISIEGQMKAVA